MAGFLAGPANAGGGGAVGLLPAGQLPATRVVAVESVDAADVLPPWSDRGLRQESGLRIRDY